MGWNLVRHAFSMVFGNINNALKASVVPFGILIVIILALVRYNPDFIAVAQALATDPETAGTLLAANFGAFFLAFIIAFVAYFFVFSWVAVVWHRFILLEEYPGIVPPLADRPVLAYIGKTLILALILFVISIPIGLAVGLITGLFAAVLPGGLAFLLAVVIGLIMGAVFLWIWFRLGVVLPATAIRNPMAIGEGWRATEKVSQAIFVAVLIIAAISFGADLLVGALFGHGGMPGIIAQIVMQWISLMVGASMLTTIYGHVIEGRDLV